MRIVILALGLCCLPASRLLATHPLPNDYIQVFLTGQNEVGPDGRLGAGDPDGSAKAMIENDHGMLVWTMDYENISGQGISGLHIHGPGATPTTNRPVFIDFPLLIDFPPPGIPLPNGTIFGTVSSADDPALASKLQQVFENPHEFYLNLHTTGAGGFPDGAVRGQLPEPGSAGLVAIAAVGLLRRGRKVPSCPNRDARPRMVMSA